MKVVIAPDSFKESMSAAEAAAAIARGVRSVVPGADCVLVPMADGGEGTTNALVAALGGAIRKVRTQDALGRPIEAEYGLTDDGLAIIEVAAAVGIEQVAPEDRDIMQSSSRGVGVLVRAGLDAGASRLIVGLGGSVTSDGGAGLLTELGVRLLDANGASVPPTPSGLTQLASVEISGLDPRLAGIRIDVACDVSNPLLGPAGAAAIFGPQKGATPEQVPILDATLERLATLLLAAGMPDVRDQPGAGAAGGLGGAFLTLGGRMRRGVEVVAEAAGLAAVIAGADLVLTGEGSIDSQTLSGKTPAGVAEIAARQGVPVIAFAGRVGPDSDILLEHGFAAIVPIMSAPADLSTALVEGPANLERAAATTLRLHQLTPAPEAAD